MIIMSRVIICLLVCFCGLVIVVDGVHKVPVSVKEAFGPVVDADVNLIPEGWSSFSAVVFVQPTSLPRGCFQIDACMKDECPVNMVFKETMLGGTCVPDTLCGNLQLGTKCVYMFRIISDSDDLLPVYAFKPINSTHLDFYVVPPACQDVLDLSDWNRSVFINQDRHIKKLIYDCETLKPAKTTTFTAIAPYISRRIRKNLVFEEFKVVRVSSIVKSFHHTVFMQDCSALKALCYNTISENPFFELYNCEPSCTRILLENYDIIWYKRWASTLVNFFSLENLKFFIAGLIRFVVSAIFSVISYGVSVLVEAFPSIIEAGISLAGELALMGVFETAIVGLFVYSYGSMPLAIITMLIFSYLQSVVHNWYNISM